jgi:membrane protease YdiL (CAAX protease family)
VFAFHALVVVGVVLGLALLLGVVDFAPWWRAMWPSGEALVLFLAVNLLFTCVAEEAFFRGLVQGFLTRWLHSMGRPTWWAVPPSALLFGLAHAGGGAAYALLATLAGLGYGWVCLRTGRVGAAIALHFTVNAVHVLFFTYPRLA